MMIASLTLLCNGTCECNLLHFGGLNWPKRTDVGHSNLDAGSWLFVPHQHQVYTGASYICQGNELRNKT